MAWAEGSGRVERGRCDYCKQAIPAAATVITASGGLVFDSVRCQERYFRRASLRALSNVTRVARSRLKVRTLANAERVYRKLGGRDWSMVKMLLGAVL